jgi:pseudaminic acid synthase
VGFVERVMDVTQPPMVVAEMSGNHGGSLKKALSLVDAAFKAGADALKLQTYKPETITVQGEGERFTLKDGLWTGRSLHQLYEEAMTPWEWHRDISQKAKQLGMYCFSSPFDESAVDFLEAEIGPPAYKIASFELNHFPLLKKIAKLGKPVIASLGVSNDSEAKKAFNILTENGAGEIFLLHCVSEYPAKISDFCMNLMPEIKEKFGVTYGLSDHSPGHLIPVIATALGARIIEKHFCLDRENSTIDGAFSMLPEEFSQMVREVHLAHDSLTGKIIPKKSTFFRRSILVSAPILEGETLDEMNIRIARPGDGLCPSCWEEVVGKKALKNLNVGHPLNFEDFC